MKKFRATVVALAVMPALAGCDGMIYEDLDPCRTTFQLKFRYDYNILNANAFAGQVSSINVWVFDESGRFVWAYSESGAPLASDDYVMELPLPEGRYDIVSWCGLKDNDGFRLADYEPSEPKELSVEMLLSPESKADDSNLICDTELKSLFHGAVLGVELKKDSEHTVVKTVEVPLVKDTHYMQVLLQNMNGEAMKADDFSFRITAANQWLDWTNAVVPSMPVFSYMPWNVMYGQAGVDTSQNGATITALSTLMAEMTTSRLMADSQMRLIVTRLTDGVEIIRIPLIDNLLLIKGHYRDMPDQEFLDRKDEFTLTFFLDSNLNWDLTNGICIQNWTVVPVQESDL
ncbi:MAG: FimB/Mfa2 family fimbrial subunit [Muribaculum sp.]|nr:FimB/Mfa2 family fimbrial subunit [Muribaculum sp.]